MLRGIVFDMDGVIVDSHPTHRRAWKQFFETVGKNVSEQQLDFILDGRKREEILRYFLGELSPERLALYGAQKDDMLRAVKAEVPTIPGILEFLQALAAANMLMAIATSASHERTLGTLDRFGITANFSSIVTGSDVRKGKPDPTIYRLVARRLETAPEELLVFEDAVSGVRAAKAAGMRCFAVATNGRADLLVGAGADHVIPDFAGLSLAAVKTLWTKTEVKSDPTWMEKLVAK